MAYLVEENLSRLLCYGVWVGIWEWCLARCQELNMDLTRYLNKVQGTITRS